MLSGQHGCATLQWSWDFFRKVQIEHAVVIGRPVNYLVGQKLHEISLPALHASEAAKCYHRYAAANGGADDAANLADGGIVGFGTDKSPRWDADGYEAKLTLTNVASESAAMSD